MNKGKFHKNSGFQNRNHKQIVQTEEMSSHITIAAYTFKWNDKLSRFSAPPIKSNSHNSLRELPQLKKKGHTTENAMRKYDLIEDSNVASDLLEAHYASSIFAPYLLLVGLLCFQTYPRNTCLNCVVLSHPFPFKIFCLAYSVLSKLNNCFFLHYNNGLC